MVYLEVTCRELVLGLGLYISVPKCFCKSVGRADNTAHVLCAAGTLLPQKNDRWRELQSSSSYSEPKTGCEPCPVCCVGQRAGGSVGGVSVGGAYSRFGEERRAVESLEA